MKVTQRSLGVMILLMIITLGLYIIYWFVATKLELNRLGAKIPTSWLFIIPIVNFYFLYKFAEAFTIFILKDESQKISFFLLVTLLMPVGMIICQYNMNKIANT